MGEELCATFNAREDVAYASEFERLLGDDEAVGVERGVQEHLHPLYSRKQDAANE